MVEAVPLVREGGKSLPWVAKDQDLTMSVLRCCSFGERTAPWLVSRTRKMYDSRRYVGSEDTQVTERW